MVLDRLRELQDADLELRRLEGRKAAHDRTLRIRAEQLEKGQAEIDALRAQQKQIRMVIDRKELEVKEKRSQIERLKQQQMQVKDNRQYAALQNEIRFAELGISKLEDEMLSDFEDMEAAEAKVREAKAQLERQQAELEAFRTEIEAKKDEVDAEIDACRKRRSEIESALPREAVDLFNRIADRLEGDALAPVIRDEDEAAFSCGGCNMSVTQNTYVLLLGRQHDELITCPNCSRILYVED